VVARRPVPHPSTMNRTRVHLVVSGRVQGVCFRAETSAVASQLDLTGFVRNLPAGDVEILAEGDRAAVRRLVEWARRGPSMAHVTNVSTAYEEPRDDFDSFGVRY